MEFDHYYIVVPKRSRVYYRVDPPELTNWASLPTGGGYFTHSDYTGGMNPGIFNHAGAFFGHNGQANPGPNFNPTSFNANNGHGMPNHNFNGNQGQALNFNHNGHNGGHGMPNNNFNGNQGQGQNFNHAGPNGGHGLNGGNQAVPNGGHGLNGGHHAGVYNGGHPGGNTGGDFMPNGAGLLTRMRVSMNLIIGASMPSTPVISMEATVSTTTMAGTPVVTVAEIS